MNQLIEKEIFQKFKRTLSDRGVGIVSSVEVAKSLSKKFMSYTNNHVPSGCKDNISTFGKMINSPENMDLLNDLAESFGSVLSRNKVSGNSSEIVVELINNVLGTLNAGAIEIAEKKTNREKIAQLMEKGTSGLGTGITKRLTSPI